MLGAATLALGGAVAIAQNGYQGQYDNQHWGHGPQGYTESFPEQGGPQIGARQGWQAGFQQGQSDREHGHSFRPTDVDAYKHIPHTPSGYSGDQFKNEYRQGFVKGYSKGYGR